MNSTPSPSSPPLVSTRFPIHVPSDEVLLFCDVEYSPMPIFKVRLYMFLLTHTALNHPYSLLDPLSFMSHMLSGTLFSPVIHRAFKVWRLIKDFPRPLLALMMNPRSLFLNHLNSFSPLLLLLRVLAQLQHVVSPSVFFKTRIAVVPLRA